MSRVFPGVDDVLASPLCLVSMFMSDDLPTFERPMNANSGMSPSGHFLTSVLLITNSACFISIFSDFSFVCLIAVARTSKTMLKSSGESGHPCLVPDLSENY